jgi:hypothetical protein
MWSPEGDDIYIGSSTQPLYKRFYGHKCKRNCSSKILFEKYNDIRIELLECCPCDNKEELNKKEGEYIRKLNCVNKCVAGRTQKEYYENNKEYYNEKNKEYKENNKEKINEKNKEYRENNKAKIIEYMKEYNKNNKLQKQKYYQENKEKINERVIQRITCECGRTITLLHKARHERSKFHQDAISGASLGKS